MDILKQSDLVWRLNRCLSEEITFELKDGRGHQINRTKYKGEDSHTEAPELSTWSMGGTMMNQER